VDWCQLNLFVLSGSLLVHVQFNTALSGLALVMHFVVSGLLSAVAGQGSHSTANSTLSTITDTLSEIAQLAFGFLSLTLEVLFTALLLEIFAADNVAEGFLCAANGLIPLTLASVLAVHCRGAGRANGEGTCFGGSVGEVRLNSAFALVFVGFGLCVMG
jgi:hypothetical protein